MIGFADNLAAALAALLLASILGYGPARWLLPAVLRPWFWLATPLIGLTVGAVVLGWLSIVLPIGTAAPLLLVLAVALTVGVRRAPPRGPQRWKEQLWVGGAATAGALIALAPLLGRPDLVSIGPNWDIEIYLPMAEYLKRNPVGFGLTDPAGFPFSGEPNPLLWRVNFFDPRWSGLAFSQLHATVGVLTGQDAYRNLPGLLALQHGLAVPAAFLLVRVCFGFPAALAVAAAWLLAVNPAVLHTVFWSFGQQASGLPLLPWALVTAALALPARGSSVAQEPQAQAQALSEDGRPWHHIQSRFLGGVEPRTVVLAGLALAAVMASFIPIAVVYALGLSFLLLLRGRTGGIPATAALAGASFLLAPWAYLRGAKRLYHFVADGGIGGLTTGPDVAEFPSLGWAFGFMPTPEHGFLGLLDAASGPSLVASAAVRLLLVALLAAALWTAARSRNAPLLAFGGAAVGMLIAVRVLTPYPYGYLKLLSGSAFLLVALALAGGFALVSWRPRLRLPVTLVAGGLAAANLIAVSVLLPYVAGRSPMAYRPLAGLETAVPSGGAVLVSGHPEYQGPLSGVLAYFLRDARLYGYLATGFSSFYRLKEDGVYDFALYHAHEPAPRELHGDGDPVWTGGGLKLYRVRPGALYFRDFGESPAPPVIERTAGQGSAAGLRITEWTGEGYPDFQGWSPPGLGVLAEITRPEGRYPEIVRGTFGVSLPRPSGPGSPYSAGQNSLRVGLAAFREQEVSVLVNGKARSISLTPGLGIYPAGAVDLPAVIELTNAVETPVYLKSVTLDDGGLATVREDVEAGSLLVTWQVQPAGQSLQVTIRYLGPPFRPAFDIYSNDGRVHYGYWELPTSRPGVPRRYRLRFEPGAGRMTLVPRRQDEGRVLSGRLMQREDGSYRASLALWDGERLAHSIPLFEFRLEGNRLLDVKGGAPRVFIG